MKFFTLILLSFIMTNVNATDLANYLESSEFNELCSSNIIYKKIKIPGTNEYRDGYITARPLFAESLKYLFVAKKDFTLDNSYSIEKINKLTKQKESLTSVFQKARDLLVIESQQQLLLLVDNSVMFFDFDGVLIRQLVIPRKYKYNKNDHAYAMEVSGDDLYIANGVHGIAKINLLNFKVEKIDLGLAQNTGHYSVAASISITKNKELIVGIDNLTAPSSSSQPFNGLIKVMTQKNNKILKFPYNPRSSGVFTRVARTIIVDDTLWINNWGTVQTIKLSKLNKEKKIKVRWFSTVVEDQVSRWHYQPLGDFFVVNDKFYSCAKKTDIINTTSKKDIVVSLILNVN